MLQAAITRVLRALVAEDLVHPSRAGVGARLLEAGVDEIRLLVSRPSRTAENAQRIAPGTWCSMKASRVSWTAPPA
jgi:hypothetical protein